MCFCPWFWWSCAKIHLKVWFCALFLGHSHHHFLRMIDSPFFSAWWRQNSRPTKATRSVLQTLLLCQCNDFVAVLLRATVRKYRPLTMQTITKLVSKCVRMINEQLLKTSGAEVLSFKKKTQKNLTGGGGAPGGAPPPPPPPPLVSEG